MDIESEHPLRHTKRVKKQINKKKAIGDSIVAKDTKTQTQNISQLYATIRANRQNNVQTLLLKEGGRTEFFVTQDSHRYITQVQLEKISKNYEYVDPRGYFDSVQVRYVRQYTAHELQYNYIVAEFRSFKNITTSFREALRLDLSPIRMWQVSLAGAVLFGMVSMSMIYKNLGQSAFAKESVAVLSGAGDKVVEQIINESETKEQNVDNVVQNKQIEIKEKEKEKIQEKQVSSEKKSEVKQEKIKNIDSAIEKEITKEQIIEEVQKKDKEIKPVDSIVKSAEINIKEEDKKDEDKKEYSLEEEAYELVEGYPIEKMLPYILEQDPEVAKYLIAIAKQESAWGKRVPVLNGQDCYNYWGYRGKRKLMGSGGHTCFNSRKDAVETVGKRIHELIYEYDRKSADKLVVWKCGSSCAGHAPEGVQRWIGVVDTYYDKLSGTSS
jgi:hypothetical protein